jgi:hypothetical protein
VAVFAGTDVSVAAGKLVDVSVGPDVLVALGFSVGDGSSVATLLAIVVGVPTGGSVGRGVGLAIGGTRLGAGVAIAGAVLSFTGMVVDVMPACSRVAGGSPPVGVRSAAGCAGRGDGVGVMVGVGELLAGTIGANMATGTTPGSSSVELLSCSAASAAWGLGGGISGIAPSSQA